MKIYIVLTLLIIILLPLTVQATTVRLRNPLEAETLWELIDMIINIIFTLSLAIAPIMFILAGFFFVTAQGDPEKIERAKKLILWTFIGLLVVMGAKGMISLFREIFGIEALSPGLDPGGETSPF